MKRSLSVLLLAGTALMAASAQAAPVFLLQFGSFESREEADAKLTGLKSKHAGVLSRMESGVREVNLPPNNLTVYRTQAGPLATRADAQSVCSQLASNGDECYVVETAMMPSFSAPAAQVAEATPPAPAPAPAPMPSPAVAAEPMPAPVATTPPAPAPVATVPAAAPVPVAMATSGRDPQNVAAMNRVAGGANATETAMPEPSAAVMAARTEASAAAMHEELAAAAGRQAAGIEAEAPQAPAKKDPSLWNRLFGSDEDEQETVKRAPAPAPDAPVKAAPVEPIAMAAAPAAVPALAPAPAPVPAPVMPPPPVIIPAPMADAPPAPTPPGAAPERSVILPAAAPIAAPAPVMAPTPVMAPEPAPAPVAMAAPVVTQAEPFPLPPPPAPLVGKSQPVMATPPAPQPIVTGTMPMPAPAPVMAPPPPAPMAPVPSFSAAKVGVPNVQVEEAKRVPLTQATAPQAPVMAPPVPLPAAPTGMPASLSPSATLGQKTLWAQVGPFRDQQSALAYWDDYRRAHPDFPVVRVRVTSPMQAHQRGLAHVTLRVGPFAREATIRNLCTTMTAPDLQCGPMTDMGFASGAGKQRGMLPQSRYNR